MVVKPLSQRDPRWASKKLGDSKLTIGNYGCLLTSLTMLLNYMGYAETPETVNNTLKRIGGFSGALIIWSKVAQAYPKLKFVYRDYNYNNAKVAWFVYAKALPVLVEVNGARIGAAKHWVLFKGGQKANDPWTGKEIPTNYYPLTGDGLYDRA